MGTMRAPVAVLPLASAGPERACVAALAEAEGDDRVDPAILARSSA